MSVQEVFLFKNFFNVMATGDIYGESNEDIPVVVDNETDRRSFPYKTKGEHYGNSRKTLEFFYHLMRNIQPGGRNKPYKREFMLHWSSFLYHIKEVQIGEYKVPDDFLVESIPMTELKKEILYMTTGTAQYEDFAILYLDEFAIGMTAKEFELKARQFISEHRLTYNDGKKDVPLTFTRFRDAFHEKIDRPHKATAEERRDLMCERVSIYKFSPETLQKFQGKVDIEDV